MNAEQEISYPEHPVLIVDDEEAMLSGTELVLESDGILNIITCQDSRDVESIMESTRCSVVLLDLSMPHLNGDTLLPRIKKRHLDVPIIIVTGHNDLDTAIDCMKAGAFDYLTKPVHESRLTSSVRRAIELNELTNEYKSFKSRVLENNLDHPEAFDQIVTDNAKMQSMFQYMETIAATPRPVLITGETGVGKELVAAAIHKISPRNGPFVAVNVAGLDDNVFSDTLFGHLSGAFTGANKVRKGLVHKAKGGTLFLDEIGDLEMSSQVKLLRLLQENEYYPLGADGAVMSDARIVVATNRTISDLQSSDNFRQDLYFRLQTHHVRIPPLRERSDDIPLLAEHFIKRSADILNKKPPAYPANLTALLSSYKFIGNIRELEGMVFEAMTHHKSGLLPLTSFKRHLKEMGHTEIQIKEQSLKINANENNSTTFVKNSDHIIFGEKLPPLGKIQELLIIEALFRTSGNQTAAAEMIGITRSGLNKAIKRKNL